MEDRPVMTDDEMIKDYPRLKLEYTRLHEDFRRLQSKQLIIGDVSGSYSVNDMEDAYDKGFKDAMVKYRE